MRLLIPLFMFLAGILTACDSDSFFQKLKQPPTQSVAAKSTRGGHDVVQAAPISGEIASSAETAAAPIAPIVVKGSGAFAGAVPQADSSTSGANGDITLNFVNADIKD